MNTGTPIPDGLEQRSKADEWPAPVTEPDASPVVACCCSCAYADPRPRPQNGVGQCRRYPRDRREAMLVSGDDWCGEFLPPVDAAPTGAMIVTPTGVQLGRILIGAEAEQSADDVERPDPTRVTRHPGV